MPKRKPKLTALASLRSWLDGGFGLAGEGGRGGAVGVAAVAEAWRIAAQGASWAATRSSIWA